MNCNVDLNNIPGCKVYEPPCRIVAGLYLECGEFWGIDIYNEWFLIGYAYVDSYKGFVSALSPQYRFKEDVLPSLMEAGQLLNQLLTKQSV